EIDRARPESERERVAERIEIRAAVMVDDALRIPGRARRVQETDRLPLVRRSAPLEFGIALGEQGLVVLLAEELAALVKRVVDGDDRDTPFQQAERSLDRLRELAIRDEKLGVAVLQDERD